MEYRNSKSHLVKFLKASIVAGMPGISLEQRILDTCRNQRRSVEMRVDAYSEKDLVATAQALMDCAHTLARYLGRSYDDVIRGRDVLSQREVELLMKALRNLQEQAVTKRFDCGLTAILALKAVIGLNYISKLDPTQALRKQRERELRLMGVVVDNILAHHDIRATAV